MIRLRALRQDAGIPTQEQLASLCRLPQQHISALESGKIQMPNLVTARKLVAGLNQRLPRPITIDDLFTPEEPRSSCPTT